MLKKIKKYLLLIPLILVLCFNVCVYGSVQAVDYASYHHNLSDCPYDFSSVFDPDDADSLSSAFPPAYEGSRGSFFVCIYLSGSNYNNFLNGLNYTVEVRVIDFYSSSLLVNNDSFYRFGNFSSHCVYTYNFDVSTGVFTSKKNIVDRSRYDLVYFKESGQVLSVDSSLSTDEILALRSGSHYYYQYTDFDGFDLFNFENESILDVDVVFSPELTGAFNRTVSDRGQKVTLDDFSFKVFNNSNFDIQYLMAIYRESDYFLPFNTDPLVAKYDSNFNGKTYNGSPVYVYVKDEWLYLPHRQNGVITGYAPSSWHMVSAGDSDFVTINFNQVKLNTYQNYNVVVYAVRNDLAYVTPFTNLHEFQVPACADYNVELDTLQLVYSSHFSILNPAEFDATNNENSYAFDENDRLLFNRANGYIDENGEMVIDRVDTNQWVTEGSDDPWVNFDSDLNAWDTYYKNQNTVSSDIDQLSRNFSSFFKFVNKFFSYFPKNYQSIIILGLTSMVVLGLFKVLI